VGPGWAVCALVWQAGGLVVIGCSTTDRCITAVYFIARTPVIRTSAALRSTALADGVCLVGHAHGSKHDVKGAAVVVSSQLAQPSAASSAFCRSNYRHHRRRPGACGRGACTSARFHSALPPAAPGLDPLGRPLRVQAARPGPVGAVVNVTVSSGTRRRRRRRRPASTASLSLAGAVF
jgi:hypothetical protein